LGLFEVDRSRVIFASFSIDAIRESIEIRFEIAGEPLMWLRGKAME
jgi:hypothetical protein